MKLFNTTILFAIILIPTTVFADEPAKATITHPVPTDATEKISQDTSTLPPQESNQQIENLITNTNSDTEQSVVQENMDLPKADSTLPTDHIETAPIPQENADSATTTTKESSPRVHVVVHFENQFLFNSEVNLPTTTTFLFHNSIDPKEYSTSTDKSSVLTALLVADATSTAFDVSDIVYYEDFNSMLVNCIQIAETDACYNWNYVVNDTYPQIGMDQYTLVGDEKIYVYFSTPWQITTPTSTVSVNETVTLETWRYLYESEQHEWTHDPHTLINIAVPNPQPTGWWDTTIVVSTTVSNAFGYGTYTFASTGTYYASITSLDFTKWSNPITVTIIEPVANTPTTPTSTPQQPPTEGNGGGGGGGNQAFNVERAIAFLTSAQQENGSFGNSLYTDWAAVAFGAHTGTSEAKEALKQYLIENTGTFDIATDVQRRAMALMALGINPYTGTATNVIQKILDQYHNGQFGEMELYNDDIFAFFPLLRAGIPHTDPRIVSSTAFILSAQSADGSWNGADLTGAALQALSLVPELPGVSNAISRGRTYLQQHTTAYEHDVFALSWVMQGLAASGGSMFDTLLKNLQQGDGGVTANPNTANNRVWGTSYAIPAALGKPWAAILVSFTQPAAQNPEASSGVGGYIIPPQPEEISTSTIPTSSMQIQIPEEQEEIPTLSYVSSSFAAQEQTTNQEKASTIVQMKNGTESVKREINTPTPTEEIHQPQETQSTAVSSTPSIQETAKNVFRVSAVATVLLGIYLVWRFFKARV